MARNKYYAVRKGRKVGVFRTWDECNQQVNGFPGAEYKCFVSIEKANEYIGNVEKENNDCELEDGIITEKEHNTCRGESDKLIKKSKKLKISLSQAKEMITKICEEKEIVYSIKNINNGNNVNQLNIHLEKNLLNSIINIYSSKQGLTLSVDPNLNPELSSLVLTKMLNENQINKVEDKTYTYKNVSIEKIENLNYELEVFNDSNEYTFNKRENYSNVKTSYEIISKTSKEKVFITIYNNNTLKVSGKRYLLWEDVCYIIEQCLGITLNDIIGRINVGIDFDFKQDNCDNCDDELRKELGDDLCDFIENHDYDVMLSVKCSFDYKNRVPDYGIYIDPLTKSFEGYFKKILTTLGIVRKLDIKKRDWKFSSIFDSDKKLCSDLHGKLDVDLDIRSKQLDVLSKMCDKMWSIRNPINHSDYRGTLSYNNYKDAYKEYNEIIALVIESYNLLVKK